MRVLGIEIPDHEPLRIGLTRIYGIGNTNAAKLLSISKLDPDKRVKDLTKSEVSILIKALDGFEIEGDLRKKISDNIARLREIKSYRGIRHILRLPVRGQRTKTNARTRKGSKKTVGAMTKEMWAKIETQQRAAQEKSNKD